jgi:hypothetical protein
MSAADPHSTVDEGAPLSDEMVRVQILLVQRMTTWNVA